MFKSYLKKSVISFLLLLFTAPYLFGQTVSSLVQIEGLRPLQHDSQTPLRGFEQVLVSQRVLLLHPTFRVYHYFLPDSLTPFSTYLPSYQESFISIDYTGRQNDLGYIFYDGNKQRSLSVRSGGEKYYKGIGVLSGMASYSRSNKENVQYNYADRVSMYLPYIVTDTTSQPSKVALETYEVSGSFASRLGAFMLGIAAQYEGEVYTRLTDPRLGNYFSALTVKSGVSTQWGRRLLLFSLGVKSTKESVSATVYRPLGEKFLSFYGFGHWNRREVSAGYGYNRFYIVREGFGRISLKRLRLPSTRFDYLLDVQYRQSHMKTQEDLGKNLFSSITQMVAPTIWTSFSFSPSLTLNSSFVGDYWFRKGSENLYKAVKEKPDEALFDYALEGTTTLYRHYILSHIFSSQLRYQRGANSWSTHFSLLYSTEKERYLSPLREKRIERLTTSLGIGYTYFGSNQSFDIWCDGRRTIAPQKYLSEMKKTPDVSYRHLIEPYLIQSSNGWGASLLIDYNHLVSQRQDRLGIRAVLDTDTNEFSGKIINGTLSLYYLF